MIFVLTGDGKGKTTCAVGMGVRAVGAGRKVKMIQFLKTGTSSEIGVVEEIRGFDVVSFGQEGFISPRAKHESPGIKLRPASDRDVRLVNEGVEEARKAVFEYDVVILDEVNVVLDLDLVEVETIEDILEEAQSDVVLTGRNCPDRIVGAADLVTTFESTKHHYERGEGARLSVEY